MGLGTYLKGVGREAADIPHAIGTYIKGTVPQQFSGVLRSDNSPVRLGNSINAKENLSRQVGDLGAAIMVGRKETTSSSGINGTKWTPGVKRYTDKYKIDNGPSQNR
jgi:hypothetical protein